MLASRTRLSPREVPGLSGVPLQLHGAYRIREILTAVGYLTAKRGVPSALALGAAGGALAALASRRQSR